MAACRLLVVLRLPLEVGAGHVVEQEFEVHPEPALVLLHEVLAQPVLVCPHLVQRPIQPVVVDRMDRNAGEVLQGRAGVPRLGNAQLGRLTAELAHGEYGGDVGPCDLLPAGFDEGLQELVQPQPPPERQTQEYGAELANAPDLDAAQVGQFPGAGLGLDLGGSIGEVRLARSGLTAVQERIDLVPTGAEVVVVELAQGGNDPLPWTALGTHRLTERPVIVGLPIDALTVFAEEHALVFPGGRRVPRVSSPLQETFGPRPLHFRAFQEIRPSKFRVNSYQPRNLG